MSEQHLGIAGLYTDPNPLSKVPKGALRIADNIVVRQADIAEPRPGFELLDTITLSGAYGLWSLFRDEMIASSASGYLQWVGADTELTDENGNSFTAYQYLTGFVPAGKSVYFDEAATYAGVRKIEAAGDATAQLAGCPMIHGYPTQGASSGTAVTNGYVVAYRYVLGRKDGNEVVYRSAPSARVYWENAQAGPYDVNHVIFFHDSITVDTSAQHFIEVYRSREVASGTTPSDELFLAAYYEPTTTEVGTTGYVTVTDTKPQAELGAALYTNPSREGIEQANHRPPSSAYMEVFKGSLFFLYTIQPRRLRLEWFESGVLTGTDTGIGYRTFSVTLTSGSATGTVASTTGIRVGQLVEGTHFNGTDPVRVASFVANTSITFTETANTSSTESLTLHDSIRVTHTASAEDQYYPAAYAGHFIEAIMHGTQVLGTDMRLVPSSYVTAWGSTFITLSVDGTPYPTNSLNRRVIYLEALKRDGGAYSEFKVYATHGSDYNPALGEPTGTATEAEPDLQPARLYWSKNGEYEHVPLGNYRDVAEADGANYGAGIIATSNTLWIFLQRGLYRLTGYGARSGWRIDPVDPELQLLAPRAICMLNEIVYAWTHRGVVRISDGGIQPIGSPYINNKLEAVQREVYGSFATFTTIKAFMVANPKNDEIILAVPSYDAPTTVCTTLYVYNVRTGAWTTWMDGAAAYGAGCLDEETQLLAFGMYAPSGESATGIEIERHDAANPYLDVADREYSVTINSVSGTQVTIAAASGWTPAVGDMLIANSLPYVVVSVDSATVFDVHTTITWTGAGTGYVGFQCDMEWVAKTDGLPGGKKRFVAVHHHFLDYHGVYTYTSEHTSDLSGTASSVARTFTYATAETQPKDDRVFVGRAHGVASQLRPRVKIKQAGGLFRFTGVTVESKPFGSLRGSAR